MKIAHVVRSDSFAGVERYMCMLAPRLVDRGCEVTVIGGDQLKMRPSSDSVRWQPAATTWEATAKLAGLGRLDIVHAHMTAAELAAVIAKPCHHARLVATLHFATPRSARTSRWPLRQLGRFMDEQIAISNFVAAAVTATRVLPNGVEAAEPGPTIRDRSILVMQRLEMEKQTDVALLSWARCRLRSEGWRLIVAGRGSKLSALQKLATDLGVSETVEWLGFVDNPAPLLSHTGLLLAPAPAEPFGLTVVEAMAHGTPVIAADGGAHRETVGPDGWLFPVGDVDGCTQLLDDVENRDLDAYGASLRTRQLEHFDIETHSDELLKVYRELLR